MKKDDFVFIHLSEKVINKFDLPEIGYPFPIAGIAQAADLDGDIEFEQLLLGLLAYSSLVEKEWELFESAILRLSELVIPGSEEVEGNIHTPDFYLRIQAMDFDQETISIFRGDKMLAAIQPTTNRRLAISVFHGLDAKTVESLINMSRHPNPKYGVCMRENNWEYALDVAAPRASSMYATQRGESYFSYWQHGLGVLHDGNIDPEVEKYRYMEPVKPNIIAAQIGAYYKWGDQ